MHELHQSKVFLHLFAFLGNSLSAILDGKARLLFLNRDEEYVITMPYAHCKGNEASYSGGVCAVMYRLMGASLN